MNVIQYKNKSKRLEQLLKKMTIQKQLSNLEFEELNRISDEIADYEEVNFPFKVDSLKEMIELRMYQRKLKQKDLAEILDTTPSRISELLNGKRKMTLDIARGLYKKLNIDAALILNDSTF